MRSAALSLGVLLATFAGPFIGHAAAAEPAALAGVYECRGVGADGKQYRGAVVIEPDGSRFLLQWYISAELTAVGLGIREGNMLAVSFFGADAGGVVLYRIDGERLVGHWSAPLTDGQVFEETLTRMGDVPPSAPSNPANPPKAPSAPENPSTAPPRPRPSKTPPFGSSRPVTWSPNTSPDSNR